MAIDEKSFQDKTGGSFSSLVRTKLILLKDSYDQFSVIKGSKFSK
jgi:hypothetical protein